MPAQALPSPSRTAEPWSHGDAHVNGVRLHYAAAGPADGPPVVLLHGFHDFWYTWRHQLPALAAAGFRAVAPDQRGYNLSDKPPRVRDYNFEHLAADVAELMRQVGGGRPVRLVGHDWGGGVAWLVAMWHPDVVERLVILNAPHPAAYNREIRRGFSQLARSWYMLAFQLPWLPEAILSAADCELLKHVFRTEPTRRGAFSEADLARYEAAWKQPGAMRCPINWYRAAVRRGPKWMADHVRPVECPTLVMWGDRDPHLLPALADGLEPWVPRVRVERLPAASHWVQHDEPERVGRLMVEFLRGGTGGAVSAGG